MAWSWDETLYEGSAPYYGAGRLPYPPALADALAEIGGGGRALDVGCGPGSLALLLAERMDSMVGVDADAEMLAAAAAAANRAGIANVQWRHLRAEQLPAGLGRFALVTFAQSFHWFDRETVAAAVHRMLDPGGACVLVHATTHRGDAGDDELPHPRPPHPEIEALVRRYLGPVRRAGRGSLPSGPPAGEDEVFRRAGFEGPERVQLDTERVVTRSSDEIVASVFSLSSSAPHLFGDRVAAFEGELRELLGGGVFAERTRDVAFDVWRAGR